MCAIPVPCDPSPLILPVEGDCVRAGFPSPAEDFQVERLDLTAILVSHPQATFFLRLRGDSMRDAGLFDGDLLVVNRALKPAHQDIAQKTLNYPDKPYLQRTLTTPKESRAHYVV